MTNKELTIRQIGEFCTSTLCRKCPVKKWNDERKTFEPIESLIDRGGNYAFG